MIDQLVGWLRNIHLPHQKSSHGIAFSIFIVSLLPSIALLTTSYFQTLIFAQRELQATVDFSARQVQALIHSAEIALKDLQLYFGNESLQMDQKLRLIQRLVYDDPRFREIGLIDDKGFLYLTSLGPIEPPLAIPDRGRANLSEKRLQLVGPLTTVVMQERSIALVLPTEGKGEINILVDPKILNYWLEISKLDLGADGFLVYLRNQDGTVLMSTGLLPVNGNFHSSNLNKKRLEYERRLTDVGITIRASKHRHWVLRHWYRLCLLTIPTTLISSTIITFLLTRLISAHNPLDHDLRNGLLNDEFELHYQPIFNLENGLCIGSEALIRWRHSDRGLLLPRDFIPTSEITGLITKIGEWVVWQTLQDQSSLLKDFPHLYVSINLSPRQIASSTHSDKLLDILKSLSAVAPNMIFELTENMFIDGQQLHLPTAIANIRSMGCKVALDDFGAGYAGIGYLSELNIDYLKIDRKFIIECDGDCHATALLDNIIDLGDRLQVTLIAEGIETESQRLALLKKGVQYGQGYLWAHPMPIAEFIPFVIQNQKNLQVLKNEPQSH